MQICDGVMVLCFILSSSHQTHFLEHTQHFQAFLPTYKFGHSILLLFDFDLDSSCSKLQLLSLLSHVNFAILIKIQDFYLPFKHKQGSQSSCQVKTEQGEKKN